MADNNTISSFHPESVAVPVIFACIFIAGVVGNGSLLYFVARFKILQTVPNVLITNLAVGDILLLIICVPFTSTVYTFSEWPYGEHICKMNEFLTTVSIGVSIFSLTVLSIERYNVITRHSFSYDFRNARRHVVVTIVGIWCLAVTLAIPDVISSHIRVYQNTTINICDPHHPSFGDMYPQMHAVIRFILLFAVPVVIITVFYVLLSLFLLDKRPQLSMSMSNGEKVKSTLMNEDDSEKMLTKALIQRKRVAWVVLCLSALFIICWLPYHIYRLWYYFDPGPFNQFWHVFKITGFCLSFLNSCVNPFVMYYLDGRFRAHFNAFLCCRQQHEKRHGEKKQPDEYSLDNLNEQTTCQPLSENMKHEASEPTFV